MSSNISTVKGHLRPHCGSETVVLAVLASSKSSSSSAKTLSSHVPGLHFWGMDLTGCWLVSHHQDDMTIFLLGNLLQIQSMATFVVGKDGKTDFCSPNLPQMKGIMFSPTSIFVCLEIATEEEIRDLTGRKYVFRNIC